VLIAQGKPDATLKPVGAAQIGYDVILIEIVDVLNDLDSDNLSRREGKREKLKRFSFGPCGDANAKMAVYRDPVWMHREILF
jgi:hypothetical protein